VSQGRAETNQQTKKDLQKRSCPAGADRCINGIVEVAVIKIELHAPHRLAHGEITRMEGDVLADAEIHVAQGSLGIRWLIGIHHPDKT